MKFSGKILVSMALLLFACAPVFAQRLQWSAKAVKAGKGLYRVEVTATIPQGFHLYDMGSYGEFGPVSTTISVEPVSNVQCIGAVKAPQSRKYNDAMYGMEIGVYEGTAVFTQMVKAGRRSSVKVKASGMVCSGQTCLPPVSETIELEIK